MSADNRLKSINNIKRLGVGRTKRPQLLTEGGGYLYILKDSATLLNWEPVRTDRDNPLPTLLYDWHDDALGSQSGLDSRHLRCH